MKVKDMGKWVIVVLTLCAIVVLSVFPEKCDAQNYWVYFKDKSGTPYTIDHPEDFLSQRAVSRRNKERIAIDRSDLPVAQQYVQQIAALQGVTIRYSSRWFNAVTVEVMDTLILDTIRQLSFVSGVRRFAPLYRCADYPTSEENRILWPAGIDAANTDTLIYGTATTQVRMIEADKLHELGYTGQGLVIAILDAGFSGVDTLDAFARIRNNGQILGYYDFVLDTQGVIGYHTHGMQVLSCMAGYAQGTFAGTAPDASFWLLRTEDTGSEMPVEEDNWVVAAEFADSAGADIIHSSLGYTTFDDSLLDHHFSDLDGNTTVITRGADLAASKGILVVNSAGNWGNNSWRHLGAPADGDSVLAVGAVDSGELPASFTSHGPSYDGRVKPNVSAMGVSATVASISGGFTAGSGTSFSAPLVSGVAACLWQSAPSASNMDIYYALEQCATQYRNPDTLTGYGVVRAGCAYSLLKNEVVVNITSDSVAVFPNPFDDLLNVILYLKDTADYSIRLLDARGRLLAYKYGSQSAGVSTLTLNITDGLSSGLYVLEIGINDMVFKKKLLRIKRP